MRIYADLCGSMWIYADPDPQPWNIVYSRFVKIWLIFLFSFRWLLPEKIPHCHLSLFPGCLPPIVPLDDTRVGLNRTNYRNTKSNCVRRVLFYQIAWEVWWSSGQCPCLQIVRTRFESRPDASPVNTVKKRNKTLGPIQLVVPKIGLHYFTWCKTQNVMGVMCKRKWDKSKMRITSFFHC